MKLGWRSAVAVWLCVLWSEASFAAATSTLPRLRSSNPVIAASMSDAAAASMTFHALVEALARTDGLVFVETGQCGHGVRSCVPHSIVRAGRFRVFRILIDSR